MALTLLAAGWWGGAAAGREVRGQLARGTQKGGRGAAREG